MLSFRKHWLVAAIQHRPEPSSGRTTGMTLHAQEKVNTYSTQIHFSRGRDPAVSRFMAFRALFGHSASGNVRLLRHAAIARSPAARSPRPGPVASRAASDMASSTPTAPLTEAEAHYEKASHELGVRFISQKLQKSGAPSPDPRRNFDADHGNFTREAGLEPRARTIGGGAVDNFRLLQTVLERGGVQAVINKRSFKNVARSLNIPKSCTSAATVLRHYYGDQLYRYEQKIVNNRDATSEELVTLSSHNKHLSSDNVISNVPVVPLGAGATAAAVAAASLARSRATGAAGTPAAAGRAGSANGTPSRGRAGVHPNSGVHDPQPQQQHMPQTLSIQQQQQKQQQQMFLQMQQRQQLEQQQQRQVRSSRRARPGLDSAALTARQAAMVQEEVGQARNVSTPFNPNSQQDRERLVAALKCPQNSEISWALGVLNVLSYDTRNTFQARLYAGLLPALQALLALHLDDVLRRRVFGVAASLEIQNRHAPRSTAYSAALVRECGDPMTGGVGGGGLDDSRDAELRAPTLQRYDSLFNTVDTMATDREHWATVAVNVLRNMSYTDRNAIHITQNRALLDMTAEILMTFKVASTIRVGVMDMWINIAPYLNASRNAPGGIVLDTCIRLLDPFLTGDYSRFANAGEVLARLAASPERNEDAMCAQFGELLPPLIDMLGGRDRRYVNAGLAALCNCSAFDWPARGRIARTPRAISRLISMLADPEVAPRASLTLHNLSQAPSNRTVMLVYEKQLVSHAMQLSPAAETIASVLFELSSCA